MFEYKSEIIETSIKWFKDNADQNDLMKLDELINTRSSEGWELVVHSYMVNATASRSAILVTFKKEK